MSMYHSVTSSEHVLHEFMSGFITFSAEQNSKRAGLSLLKYFWVLIMNTKFIYFLNIGLLFLMTLQSHSIFL